MNVRLTPIKVWSSAEKSGSGGGGVSHRILIPVSSLISQWESFTHKGHKMDTNTRFVTLRFITKGYLCLHIFFQFSFFYEIAVPSEM